MDLKNEGLAPKADMVPSETFGTSPTVFTTSPVILGARIVECLT